MASHTEYKFITTRIGGLTPSPNDPAYFNWSDVSEMLTRYGLEGWKVGQVSETRLDENSVLFAFVLERAVGPSPQRRQR